jgi:hypothetical protein
MVHMNIHYFKYSSKLEMQWNYTYNKIVNKETHKRGGNFKIIYIYIYIQWHHFWSLLHMYDPYWKIMSYKVVRKIYYYFRCIKSLWVWSCVQSCVQPWFKCSVKSQSGGGIHKIRGLGWGDIVKFNNAFWEFPSPNSLIDRKHKVNIVISLSIT